MRQQQQPSLTSLGHRRHSIAHRLLCYTYVYQFCPATLSVAPRLPETRVDTNQYLSHFIGSGARLQVCNRQIAKYGAQRLRGWGHEITSRPPRLPLSREQQQETRQGTGQGRRQARWDLLSICLLIKLYMYLTYLSVSLYLLLLFLLLLLITTYLILPYSST